MKYTVKTFVSALAFVSVMSMTTVQVSAQDLGFNIPDKETVEAQKKARDNKAASQGIGRAIMDAFELYEEEKIKEAIAVLEDQEPDPGYDSAYLGRFLGNLYAADERTADALRVLKSAVDQDVLGWSDQAAALKLVGQISLQEEKYEQSLEYLKKWVQFTGERDPQVFLYMANAHYQMKNFAEIIPFAEASLEAADKPEKNVYTLMMASYYERKMYPQAIEVLEEGLDKLPEVTQWWPQLAQFYMLEEDLAKSLQTMEIAYMAGYLDTESQYKMLVQLYDNEGIPYKAASTMEKHVEAGDIEKSAKNFGTIANSYHRAKELDKAVSWYERAADATNDGDDKGEYYRKQGNLMLLNEQYIAAATPLKKALDYLERKDQGRVYMSLAEAYFYGGDYRQAMRYVDEAATFDGQRRSARSWKGYIKSTAERKGIDLD
ncbi:tetratricopeptide repeat protein [Idiomarina loihiensis]|uniref:tetratricopeptide repeat protein n=1 Tax=Idiomarina loihiensis TaxID=135577 RepID=UPI00384ABC46